MSRREDGLPSHYPAIGALLAAAGAALVAVAPVPADRWAQDQREPSRVTRTVRDLRECVERLAAVADAPHADGAGHDRRHETEALTATCRQRRLVKEALAQTG